METAEQMYLRKYAGALISQPRTPVTFVRGNEVRPRLYLDSNQFRNVSSCAVADIDATGPIGTMDTEEILITNDDWKVFDLNRIRTIIDEINQRNQIANQIAQIANDSGGSKKRKRKRTRRN